MSQVTTAVSSRPFSCKRCFGVDRDKWNDWSPWIPTAAVRENWSNCNGCHFLQPAFEHCDKKLGVEIDSFAFIFASTYSRFSRCLLRSEFMPGTQYELLFGYTSTSGNIEHISPTFGYTDTSGRIEFMSPNYGYLPAPQSKFPVEAAKEWIENCTDLHKRCQRTHAAPLPSRVVDVGHNEACIYETKGELQPYAALSHSWFDSKPLSLKKSNLNLYRGRLIWNELPLAFQECIEFVRKLGIRYLWIDSLCIVQDDPREWEIEYRRMASIFENSKVTIALHQAGPNQTSFPKLVCAFTAQYRLTSVSFYLRRVDNGQAPMDMSRLYRRGWCFQERLLSTRIIHCLPMGVNFECTEETATCTCNSIEPHQHHQGRFKSMFTGERISNENWRKMITIYSQKDFTYQKDVLPALSGITNRVRGAGRYFGGIWEKDLPYDLLWFPIVCSQPSERREPVRREPPTAPSFLWASIHGTISFVDIGRSTADFTQMFSINNIVCQPKGEDLLGELAGGSLQLIGLAIYANFVCTFNRPIATSVFIKHSAEDEIGHNCLWAALELENVGNYIFHPDSLQLGLRRDHRLIVLLLFTATDPSDQLCYALVLAAKAAERGQGALREVKYRRVGIIASIEKEHFSLRGARMLANIV